MFHLFTFPSVYVVLGIPRRNRLISFLHMATYAGLCQNDCTYKVHKYLPRHRATGGLPDDEYRFWFEFKREYNSIHDKCYTN